MVEHMLGSSVEMGAPMDYEEHRKSYLLFVSLMKYGMLGCLSLLIAMAAGFFVTGGFFSALVLFLIICSAGFYLLGGGRPHGS